mmetsp:Transcript_21997/g.74259  ORF Transcript_21997/g.74259 Transcript_21997/m.74259 type:complete len:290 (+) Transcript_21997:597-1466(+)
MTSSWTEGAGTEAKAEVAMTSASSADAWTAREVGTEAKAEVAVATAVAVTSANSAAAAVWWRLAAAAAGAESGCTAACTGCARRLFTWRGVRRRRVLVHRDVHWLVREIGRDQPSLAVSIGGCGRCCGCHRHRRGQRLITRVCPVGEVREVRQAFLLPSLTLRCGSWRCSRPDPAWERTGLAALSGAVRTWVTHQLISGDVPQVAGCLADGEEGGRGSQSRLISASMSAPLGPPRLSGRLAHQLAHRLLWTLLSPALLGSPRPSSALQSSATRHSPHLGQPRLTSADLG